VRNSWLRVKCKTIVKSLKKCGISNVVDGIEDDILYEQSVASSDNDHEGHFRGSEEDSLGFYEE